ncbi:tetratricopeptide repeat protein [Pontiella agarivorans]|uniref:Tetratricopeptide repeat protein n=1 Tax=Pontiella agarivorans TaxID=3038953 RepID=A0ABU5MYU1_9BACT|nr:tetratricopeptide repeat protein [Pontiella agarivorans]MDZ8119380.1 tetratricopeptide repeat protein [Pontiella agarivorans]
MKSKPLFYLALSALIVRALYFFQELASPFFLRPLLDQHYYDLCARQLAGGGGDLIDGFRPLLYPLFLSGFYRIAPDSGILLSVMAQMALGVGITVLVAALSMRIFSNRTAGILAGLFFCLSAPPLYFEGQLLITTLFSFLLLVLSYVVCLAMNTKPIAKSAALWLAAGILLGLSAQARPNALPLILFFPMLGIFRWLQLRTHSRPPTTRLLSLLPLLALPGLLLIQILFGMINAQYSGKFSLMTQAGGINFYLGNSKNADGMIPRQDRYVVYEGEYRDPIQVMAEEGYREATGETGTLSQEKVSNHWKTKTIEEIKADPARWIGLMAKKTWLMFWNHEVPNNRSFEFAATEDSTLLKWLPVRWWLLLSLFPWGIAALIKQRQHEQILWIGSFLVLLSGTIILFFVNSRFRIPLWPGMAIVAGGGALYFWESIKEKSIPLTPVLFSIILLPLSLINWFNIPADPIEHDLSMRSSAYYDRGQYEQALADINRCLERVDNNPGYYFRQANILLAMEQNGAAIQSYLKAIKLNNTDPIFHNNLGIAFENSGQFEHAETAYNKALSLRPNHTAARTNLMLLYIRTDNLGKAKIILRQLLSENGRNPTLLCAHAIIAYKETGNPQALKSAQELNSTLAKDLLH